MRTRKYMTDLVGGEGNVLSHHISRAELEKKFEAAQFTDKANVKQFLDRVIADKQG